MGETQITIDVWQGADFRVVDGVQTGDPLGFADELVMDDVFALSPKAQPLRLDLRSTDTGLQRATGVPNAVHLDCCLTLIAPDGQTAEALVLVEESGGEVIAIYLMGLGDIVAERRYRLIAITRQTATRRFADAEAGSFARGTRITLADGRMRPVEDLQQGDLVLTRDAGKQPLRHIVQTTLRASGNAMPVVITKGALQNDDDLVLRPDHRVFVYQRDDLLGAGRAEVLVKARQLVNGVSILWREGGFIDYFQLILDDHQIIYAEGIAAESHLVDARTRPALPPDAAMAPHRHRPHLDYDVAASLINRQDAAALLRRASTA